MSATDQLVTLRLGAVVPAEVLGLGFELEGRGMTLTLDDLGRIVVQPASLLTDADRARLRRWRDHLVLVLREFEQYDAEPPAWRAA